MRKIVTGIAVVAAALAISLTGCGTALAQSASWQQGYSEGDQLADAVAGLPLPGGVDAECHVTLNVDYMNPDGKHQVPVSVPDYMAGCRAAWAKHGVRS